VKEQILFAVAQRNTAESMAWLMTIVNDDKQTVEVRKQALFWWAQASQKVGESGAAVSSRELTSLYDRMTDREMKEQLIFVFSQNASQTAYIDKLMDIAKNDKDVQLRKTAIFWLGQAGSKDPRVAKFLVDLING
jgi:hypothetical protein